MFKSKNFREWNCSRVAPLYHKLVHELSRQTAGLRLLLDVTITNRILRHGGESRLTVYVTGDNTTSGTLRPTNIGAKTIRRKWKNWRAVEKNWKRTVKVLTNAKKNAASRKAELHVETPNGTGKCMATNTKKRREDELPRDILSSTIFASSPSNLQFPAAARKMFGKIDVVVIAKTNITDSRSPVEGTKQ